VYWQDADGKAATIGVSEDLVSKWYTHPLFGAEFRKWYDQLVVTYGSLQEWQKQKATQGNKRAGPDAAAGVPKKLRVDVDLKLTNVDELTGVGMFQVALQNVKAGPAGNEQPYLSIRTGGVIALVNPTDKGESTSV
jgi:hypothetical protein